MAAQTDAPAECGLAWKTTAEQADEVVLFAADGSVLDAAAPLAGWQKTPAADGDTFGCAVGLGGVRHLFTASCRLGSDLVQGDVSFTFTSTPGIGAEAGVSRRDPSDVVKVGDTWFVWYSRMLEGSTGYPSGYDATVWHATSTDEGQTWTGQSE